MNDLLKYFNLTTGGWIIAGVLMMAGSAGYLYYSAKLSDMEKLNTALAQTAQQNLNTIKMLQEASDTADRVLLEREAEIEKLKNQTTKTLTEIKKIYVNDTKAKNWAETEIPQAIILRLQKDDNSGDNAVVSDGVRTSGDSH